MTPEQTDLARRLVACEQWRWMPGMQDAQGWIYRGQSMWMLGWAARNTPGLPNLTDPATCGCLLAMLWAAPGVTRAETWHYGTGAAVRFDEDDLGPDEDMSWLHAAALGEALARALLACWEAEDA